MLRISSAFFRIRPNNLPIIIIVEYCCWLVGRHRNPHTQVPTVLICSKNKLLTNSLLMIAMLEDDDDVEEEEEELVYYLCIFVWFSIFTSGRLCVCIWSVTVEPNIWSEVGLLSKKGGRGSDLLRVRTMTVISCFDPALPRTAGSKQSLLQFSCFGVRKKVTHMS